jgi:hypothetical protein
VTGIPEASGLPDGIESRFCKAAMARSGSHLRRHPAKNARYNCFLKLDTIRRRLINMPSLQNLRRGTL